MTCHLKFNFENDIDREFSMGKEYRVIMRSTKAAVLKLKSKIQITSLGEGSDILALSIAGESSALSESILNTLMTAFNSDGINDRQLVSERTINFIDDRFVFLAKELDSIEIDYQDFKEQNDIVDIVTDAAIGQEQRSASEEKLFQLENQLALATLLKKSLNEC